jgi:hypothetical protein
LAEQTTDNNNNTKSESAPRSEAVTYYFEGNNMGGKSGVMKKNRETMACTSFFFAWQPCPAALPGSLAHQPCRNIFTIGKCGAKFKILKCLKQTLHSGSRLDIIIFF